MSLRQKKKTSANTKPLTGLYVNKLNNLLSKTFSQRVNSPDTPTHPSDFLLFSSPLSTRFFIWPDTCFTLQHVNVKSTSLASVRTPTWIIIWSDVLDGAHVASDNTLKYVLTLSAPSKICDQRQQEQEDGAEEDKAAPHNSLNYTFD